MYDLIAGLGALSVWVDGTDSGSWFWLGDRSSLLGRRAGGRGGDRLGDSSLVLRWNTEGERNDLGNVRVGPVDLDGHPEGLSEETHGFETFLVVWSTAADVDLDAVGNETCLEFLEGTDDTLESSSDVGEVSNTSTNDEEFALGVGSASSDQVDWLTR